MQKGKRRKKKRKEKKSERSFFEKDFARGNQIELPWRRTVFAGVVFAWKIFFSRLAAGEIYCGLERVSKVIATESLPTVDS